MGMDFVQQREEWDCAIACMAMLSGMPYETVKQDAAELFGPEQSVSLDGDAFLLFKKYEIPTIVIPVLYGGVDALLSVPSLNNPGRLHVVFYFEKKIYDPQSGRTGKKFYEPDGMIQGAHALVDLRDEYGLQQAKHWREQWDMRMSDYGL